MAKIKRSTLNKKGLAQGWDLDRVTRVGRYALISGDDVIEKVKKSLTVVLQESKALEVVKR